MENEYFTQYTKNAFSTHKKRFLRYIVSPFIHFFLIADIFAKNNPY